MLLNIAGDRSREGRLDRRFLYKVGSVADPGGSGAPLEEMLDELAGHGWRAIHFQANPSGSWIVVFEMPAVAPTHAGAL